MQLTKVTAALPPSNQKFIFHQNSDSPQLECDLLYNADIRNSTYHVLVAMPDQINVASHDTLLLHLISEAFQPNEMYRRSYLILL